MYYFFGLVYVVMFLVNMVSNNVLLWWAVLVMSVVFFIWMCKISMSLVSMVNYFIIQESLSLLFLYFSGSVVQFLLILVKSGVTPFHLWIFSVGLDLNNKMLLWFLVVQKLPFIPVILGLYSDIYMLLLIVGIVVCHYQYYVMSNDSSLMLVSSTESFSWLLLMLCWTYYSLIFMLFYYFFVVLVVMGSLTNEYGAGSLGWDSVLLFMNFPMGVVFMTKFMVISVLSWQGVIYFVLFLSAVLTYMCLLYWLILVSGSRSGLWSSKMAGFSCFIMTLGFMI